MINLRSPYHINVTDTDLTNATLDLYVYTGTYIADQGSIIYTFNSTAFNNELTFEIAEYARDYLDIAFNGSYTSQMVWVGYRITKYINDAAQTPEALVTLGGYDGYGYFSDGANPQYNGALLQSNLIDYVSGDAYVVPVKANYTTDVKFYLNDVLQSTVLVPDTLESDEVIKYVSYTGTDKVVIDDTTTIIVNQIDECKFTPYKVTFINKFGALQDLYFFKRSDVTISTKDEKFNANILNSGTYSTSEHQSKILSKKGSETITLNSGFVDESMNEVFRQLLLSERVWINYNGTLPVNVGTSSLKFKESKNDKLINYTISFNFAYDKINNIR